MAYTIRTTNRYDKNVKLCQRRGLPMEELKKPSSSLSRQEPTPTSSEAAPDADEPVEEQERFQRRIYDQIHGNSR